DCVDPLAVDRDVPKNRRRSQVVVPKIVVDQLVMPHTSSSFGIEADDAVGKEVLTRPVPAVERIGWGRQREVNVTQFFVHAEWCPGAHASDHLPRFLAPSVDAE